MKHLKNIVVVVGLLAGIEMAWAVPTMLPETSTPPQEGPLGTQDIGAAFDHPLAAAEPVEQDPKLHAKVQPKMDQPKDVMEMFGEQKQEVDPGRNPLEEQAKKEFQAIDAENGAVSGPVIAGTPPEGGDIKAEAPKELDLGSPGGDEKDLPKMLR